MNDDILLEEVYQSARDSLSLFVPNPDCVGPGVSPITEHNNIVRIARYINALAAVARHRGDHELTRKP